MSHGLSVKQRIEDDAAVFGFSRTYNPNQTQKWQVTCSECEEAYPISAPLTAPPNALVKYAHQRGWRVSKHSAFCPNCLAKEKSMTKHPAPAPAPTAISPDPKIARKIYAHLEDHFDDVKRLYHTGWSDARIAKEIDTSEAIVFDTREKAFGKLAEDPIVASLRDEIELLRMEAQELTDRFRAQMTVYAGKITELETKMNHTVLRKVG